MLEPARESDAEQREWPRAEEHPERQPRVDVAEPAVPYGTERLEDGAVQDVRANSVGRLEVEQEHEDRRQQRPPAHAGQADEHPDQETRQGELPGQLL